MDFAQITIKDKNLFDSYLKDYNPRKSELTFTNLFMWRDFYSFRYTVANNLLCIISVPKKGTPCAYPPIGQASEENYRETVLLLLEYFNSNGWKLVFKKVSEDELELLKPYVKSEADIIFDRDNSDYVYLTEDLVNLKGKKFDGKRNHINKFSKLYEYEYVDISSDVIDECKRIMEEWCEGRNCSCQKGDYCERYANLEVLDNYDELDCKGALIKVNGKFEAFTIGERLNSDTAVIHIEKANFRIQGLYAMINQQFCRSEWQNTTYINREQDLGQEGLRKAKLSYNPVMMVNKYTVMVK
jgi:hypothetical protein